MKEKYGMLQEDLLAKSDFICQIRDQTLHSRWMGSADWILVRGRNAWWACQCCIGRTGWNCWVVTNSHDYFLASRIPVLSGYSTSTMLTGHRPDPRINDETSEWIFVIALLCTYDWLEVDISCGTLRGFLENFPLWWKEVDKENPFLHAFGCHHVWVEVVLGAIAAILRPWGGRQNKQNQTTHTESWNLSPDIVELLNQLWKLWMSWCIKE